VKIILLLLLAGSGWSGNADTFRTLSVATTAPANRTVEFAYRLPEASAADRIRAVMVVFGGRNWSGESALRRIDFRELADRFKILLLSPGFKDDEYWHPEKWSGRALEQAISQLEKKYRLDNPPLLYFGYSAGGQCANLFYLWKPERVMACGVHACGVWGDFKRISHPAPMLVTCGVDDAGRFELSRRFVQQTGDHGWQRLWAELPDGHELSPEAVELARAFFTAVLAGEKKIFWGDDQTGRIETSPTAIDSELRSYLPGDAVCGQWLKLMGRR